MNYIGQELIEKRDYLSAQLRWAKENRLWAHAERYLSELDAVNLLLASSTAAVGESK